MITWNIIDSRNGNVIIECRNEDYASTVVDAMNRGLPSERYEIKLSVQ